MAVIQFPPLINADAVNADIAKLDLIKDVLKNREDVLQQYILENDLEMDCEAGIADLADLLGEAADEVENSVVELKSLCSRVLPRTLT